MKASISCLLLLLAILLIACGDKAEPVVSKNDSSESKPAPQKPEGPAPRPSGEKMDLVQDDGTKPRNGRRPKYSGKTLLAEDPAMKKTATGLRYKFLEKGKGEATPGLGADVKVRYTVYFPDGSQAFQAKRDMEFVVGNYMKAIDEAVQLMPEGSRLDVHAPWYLAYGERGRGPVPSKCDLRIDIRLLSFKPGGEIPAFQKVDLDKAQTTDNGIKYVILAEGTGPAAGDNDVLVLDWHVWRMDGVIVQSSTALPKTRLLGQSSRLPYEFAKEMARRMKQGSDFLMVVPPELAFKGLRTRSLAPDSTSTIRMTCKQMISPFPPGGIEAEKTESGVEFWRIKKGEGRKVKAKSVVSVREANWYGEGHLYSTSYNQGGITEYPLTAIAPGKRDVLLKMRAGDIVFVHSPAELGYEKARRGVPAKTELMFYIELKKVR